MRVDPRRVGAMLAASLIVGLVLNTSVVAASSGSPAALLAASLSAARAESSVHLVSTANVSGVLATTITTASLSDGSQTVTLSGGPSVSLELVNDVVYMKGNEAGLYFLQNLTKAAAAKEAGRWIAVPSSSSVFASFATGLTVATTFAAFEMSGTVVSVPGPIVDGVRLSGLRGMSKPYAGFAATPETLYVASTGPPLPVKATLGSGASTITTVFSAWGKATSVPIPPHVVQIQKSWLQ
jgi:hypothetical protein